MWKKLKNGLLCVLLIMGIMITGTNLPYESNAAGPNDKTALVDGSPGTKIEFLQSGVRIENPGTTQIDLSKDINVNIEFKAPLDRDLSPANRIVKGDFIEFDLQSKLKFADPDGAAATVVKETFDVGSGYKICDTIFTRASDGNIKVKFDFSTADDRIFSKLDATVKAGARLRVDVAPLDPDNTSQTITIHNQNYNIGPVQSNVKVVKEGKISPTDAAIEWTLTVTKNVKDVTPEKPMSLEGHKITDVFDKTGAYVNGTFKINENSVNDTGPHFTKGTDNKSIEYTIQDADLNSANKGKAVIKFKTAITSEAFRSGATQYNTTKISKGSENYTSNEAKVEIPKFGEKRADTNNLTAPNLKWEIEFNRPGYNLGAVEITDELRPSMFGNLAQTNMRSYYQVWENGHWGARKTDHTFSGPVMPGNRYTYRINNVNARTLLTIETDTGAILPNRSYRFINEAYLFWGNMSTHKTSFSAEIRKGTQNVTKSPEYVKISAQNATDEDKRSGENWGVERIPFETEWTVTVKNIEDEANTYLYDYFIFDNRYGAGKGTINDPAYNIYEQGGTSPVTLASGLAFRDVISGSSRHQRLINPASPFAPGTDAGLTAKVYELRRGTDVVGHILEVNRLKRNRVNTIKFKSKLLEPFNLLDKEGHGFNYITLAKQNQVIDSAESWPKYNSKLVSKQALSKEAAKQFTGSLNYNAAAVNSDIFKDGKAVNNEKTAYDKDSKSVIYRISFNAADIQDDDGDLGDVTIDDALPEGWKFAPIKDTKYSLIYRGTAATDAAHSDATVLVDAGNNNYLDSTALASANIVEAFNTDKTSVRFTFSKLKGPYVIFLKAELKDDATKKKYFNELTSVSNKAVVKIERNNVDPRVKEAISTQKVTADERFLIKGFDKDAVKAQESKGYIKWNIDYKPYKTYTDNTQVSIEDVLSNNLVLRREKGTDKLVFGGDNYRMWKGSYDAVGNFTPEREITANLTDIFKYNISTKKFTINIPENNASYRISYITDFIDSISPGEEINNTVSLIENSITINMNPKKITRNLEAYAYGNLRDFEHFSVIKTSSGGSKLSGAVFSLEKVSPSGIKVNGTTSADGTIEFNRLTPGEYILKEETPPSGYKANGTAYKIKVTELEIGFKIELEENYAGTVTLSGNDLTVINEPNNPGGGGGGGFPPGDLPKDPEKPNDPEQPNKPDKPDNPNKPDNPTPDKPTEPDEPDTPDPTPDLPTYPINRVPDPNDPDSPDEILVVNEDGTPLGKFIKRTKPNGEKEYVLEEDGTPLSHFLLPKTGVTGTLVYYIAGTGLLMSAVVLLAKKRREEEPEEGSES